MKIIFNPYYDQPVYLDDRLEENKGWFNKTLAGPSKLLSILEVHLGLTGKYAAVNMRRRLYREALARSLDNKPFYEKSFKADPASSAKALLSWRDDLIIGGLNLLSSENLPKRIADLQQVEKNFITSPYIEFAGESDRWRKIFDALENKHDLPEIELIVEYKEKFLSSWQTSLIDLCREHPDITLSFKNIENSGTLQNTDLDKLKKAIISEQKGKISLTEDGSLIVINTADQIEAGQILSRYLKGKNLKETIIVSPGDINVASIHLSQNGLPSLEISSNPPKDPVLQLLHLIPSCIFDPLDVYKISELLSFPYLPFNNGLAHSLAKVMSSKPGRFSEDWREAKQKWEADRLAKGDEKEDILKKLHKIEFYLEQELYDEDDPIKAKEIKQRTHDILKDIGKWANRKANSLSVTDEEKHAFMLLKETVEEMVSSINHISDEEALNKLLYDQLLNEILTTRQRTIKSADAGCPGYSYNGTNICGDVSETIFWNCIKGENAGRTSWLPEEIQWLESQGIHYDDPEEKYKQQFFGDEEVILRTKNRLILLIPETMNGEPTEKGNLYSRIKGLCQNIHSIEYWLPEDKAQMKKILNLELCKQNILELPGGDKVYWEISNTDQVEKRTAESYSSLANLFYYPYIWFLNYQAKIRPSYSISLINEIALKGTLAHRMIELAIINSDNPLHLTEKEIEDSIEKQFVKLLQQEGAILLLPENKKELNHFKFILKKSVFTFLNECKINNWKDISIEETLTGKLWEFPLKSHIDALLEKGEEKAVVDFKYFKASYRVSDMAKDKDLQLIFYAGLAKQGALFPKSAYYFVQNQTFLAKHKKAFSGAEIAGKGNEEAELLHSQIWQKMERMAELRWKEIVENGKLEVAENLELANLDIYRDHKDEILSLPTGDRVSLKGAQKYNDYKNLVKVN